jgi:aryl-alcohol dehydrogenase-like predicted oxidoreductase
VAARWPRGALAWLWARGAHTVPVPGFRTVAQAEENADAMAHGPLGEAAMKETDVLLGR